ncbi:MAG: hypothetical protein U0984_02970, partial [Prosthecobacter sp.]|nr:hypothetical protein [Prosthecobacter sp.]
MKSFSWMAIFSVMLVAWGQAQTAIKPLEQAKALAKAGNHREAADAAKSLLKPTGKQTSEVRAEALGLAVESLRNLGAEAEAEQVIEDAARDFAGDWRMLLAAGMSYGTLSAGGMVVDGKFMRGGYRNQGRIVQTQLRDWVRQLQLLHQARLALPANATEDDREAVLDPLAFLLCQSRYGTRRAWQLQTLTDLSQLPGYDDETGLDNPATGYPVDAQGNPIYFSIPATWDAAANDGERLRWVLAEWEKVDEDSKYQSRRRLADLAASWFSVRNIAHLGFGAAKEGEEDRREGIAALHTLKDDETVAALATGPKRITLPAEWAFL